MAQHYMLCRMASYTYVRVTDSLLSKQQASRASVADVLLQTLTVCYHITHQKINIRKETSTSINVFSIASYITMAVLLVHMHSYLADYPTMPVVARGRHLWNETVGVMTHVKGAIERAEL